MYLYSIFLYYWGQKVPIVEETPKYEFPLIYTSFVRNNFIFSHYYNSLF